LDRNASVATDECFAAGEIEFPIVPIAGEAAGIIKHAFAQRIAFVRASIVAGKKPAGGCKNEDLLSGGLNDHLPAFSRAARVATFTHLPVIAQQLACFLNLLLYKIDQLMAFIKREL